MIIQNQKNLIILLLLCALSIIAVSKRSRALKQTLTFKRYTDTKVLESTPPIHNTKIYLYNAQFDTYINCNLEAVSDTDDYWGIYYIPGGYAFQCRDGYWLSEAFGAPAKSADYNSNTHWVQDIHPHDPEYYSLKHNNTNTFLGGDKDNKVLLKTGCGNWERYAYLKEVSPNKLIQGNPHKFIQPRLHDVVYFYNPHFDKFFNCDLQIVSETSDYWVIYIDNGNQYKFYCYPGSQRKWLGSQVNKPQMNHENNLEEKWDLEKVTSNLQYCLRSFKFNTYLSQGDGNSGIMSDDCKESERFSFVDFYSRLSIYSGNTYYIKSASQNTYLSVNNLEIEATENKVTRFTLLLRDGNHWVFATNIDGKSYYLTKDGKDAKLIQISAWDQATKDKVYMNIQHPPYDPQKICIQSATGYNLLKGLNNGGHKLEFVGFVCRSEEAFEVSGN